VTGRLGGMRSDSKGGSRDRKRVTLSAERGTAQGEDILPRLGAAEKKNVRGKREACTPRKRVAATKNGFPKNEGGGQKGMQNGGGEGGNGGSKKKS